VRAWPAGERVPPGPMTVFLCTTNAFPPPVVLRTCNVGALEGRG